MRIVLLLLAFGAVELTAAPAQAQVADTTATGDPPDLPPNTEARDVAIFRAIYEIDVPMLTGAMRAVNVTAYPVYGGIAPALALGAALDGGDYEPAVKMAAAQGLDVAVTLAMKRLVLRPRPYAALDGVVARDRGHMGEDIIDPYSFPSGHTSLAAASATSLSLSYPEWYVIGPAAAWVGTMGAARIWHGVHYPTDVAVGAAVGVASAVAVHLVWNALDGGPGTSGDANAVRFSIPL
ncbi:phosphatase PAP2 family protein [Rubrivirga sp. IMCC45206]|uniref:phosphatase PAP2 family protein n=1 Tax=Rubrivirga sp. IMCC45206 TaxID=3391614 RepID=UPI00398FEEFE